MLGHLQHIDADLAKMVADKLGIDGKGDKITPAVEPHDMKPSPALSQYKKAPETVEGRKFGALVADGVDGRLLDHFVKEAAKLGAKVEFIAPKVGGFTTASGDKMEAHHALGGAPSAVFDAIIVATSEEGCKVLASQAAAVDFVRMAFAHLKVIGFTAEAKPLFDKASVDTDADEGLVELKGTKLSDYFDAAKKHRIWAREPKVRD
jgi:catalase